MKHFIILVLGSLMMVAGTNLAAEASDTLPEPTGRVVLSVTGAIERTNGKGQADFDREMLEAIGMVEVETTTPFTSGSTVFRGVLARDLLRHVGANGRQIEAAAIDLYKVQIPVDDFERFDVLIALEADGKKLRVRDHGPAWVVYPWSHHAELANEVYSRRSIWQMNAINVQ